MTKLNLSALKKKADILANPPSEVSAHNPQTNSVSTILQDIPQTPTVSSSSSDTSASQLWAQPSTITTDTSTVKEFFPNLNLSDDLFDDIFAKKEIIIAEDTPQMHEVQSITLDTGVSDLITPTDGTSSETVAPFPTPVTEVLEVDISIVEWAMSEVPSVLESVATPIEQQEYVKSVAEDLSLEREGGLTRLSTSKKIAIFSLLGLSLVWIVWGGLYTFDIFPPTKTSTIEVSPLVESTMPTPAVVFEQTGSLDNTGTITSTWVTALPALMQSGAVETLSGSASTWSTLIESTLSWTNHSGVILSGTTLSGSTISGSTLTETILSGSISSGAVLIKPIPPTNSTTSVTGSSSIIRTPNIRVPLTNTGALR